MFNLNASKLKTSGLNTIAAALSLGFFIQGTGIACTLTEYQRPFKQIASSIKTHRMLKEYDVALLIDSSHSMGYEYAPPEEFLETMSDVAPSKPITSGHSSSRWEWCRAHTADLTKNSMEVLNHGPRLTVFGDHSIMYKDVVDEESVAKVFTKLRPKGGTYAARALNQELNGYFHNRKINGLKTKPLLIAMITDGSLSDLMSSRQALVNATKKMNRSDEIAVVILKVGEDPKAPETLDLLDNRLVSKYNAKFDIVEVKSFDELNDRGIAAVLADVMKERRDARVISYNAK